MLMAISLVWAKQNLLNAIKNTKKISEKTVLACLVCVILTAPKSNLDGQENLVLIGGEVKTVTQLSMHLNSGLRIVYILFHSWQVIEGLTDRGNLLAKAENNI